jgi:DNA-binding PadR family transcriptional regulator
MFGGAWEVNAGQVYLTLQKLERDELVEPIGARGDRRKLAYRLTEAGRRELDRWLDQPEVEPQQLREGIYLKLLLGGRLGNGNLGSLLARQRRAHLQRLHDLGDLEKRARREGREDLALLVRGAVHHTEADIKWIDECAEGLGFLEQRDGGGAREQAD